MEKTFLQAVTAGSRLELSLSLPAAGAGHPLLYSVRTSFLNRPMF